MLLLLARQGESVDPMSDRQHLRRVKPLGRFRAMESRDASSLERDGEIIYAANQLSGSEPMWEVMFEDGVWLLATPGDVEWL